MPEHYDTGPQFSYSQWPRSITTLSLRRVRGSNTFACLAAHFNEGEICDIVWLVASEHLSNLTNIGLNIGWDRLCRIERAALHKRCCNPF